MLLRWTGARLAQHWIVQASTLRALHAVQQIHGATQSQSRINDRGSRRVGSHTLSAPCFKFGPASRSSSSIATASGSIDATNNPMLDVGLPRFDEIKVEHIKPAVVTVLKRLEHDLDRLERHLQPTWEHLMEPLEDIQTLFTQVWSKANHLRRVHNSSALRKVIAEVEVSRRQHLLRTNCVCTNISLSLL